MATLKSSENFQTPRPWTHDTIVNTLPEVLSHFQLDTSKLVLGSSSGLVYKGVLEEANDVDLYTDSDYFKELSERFPEQVISNSFEMLLEDKTWGRVRSEKIVLKFKDLELEIMTDLIGGQQARDSYHCNIPKIHTLGSIIYLKARLGRTKDLEHIAKAIKDHRKTLL